MKRNADLRCRPRRRRSFGLSSAVLVRLTSLAGVVLLLLRVLPLHYSIGSVSAFAAPSSGRSRPFRPGRGGGSTATSGRGGGSRDGGGGRSGGRSGRGRGGRGGGRTNWAELRKSGVKSKNRSKAPRWEKEGDSLYHAVVAKADGGGAGLYGSVGKATTIEEARDILSRLASKQSESTSSTGSGEVSTKPTPHSTNNKRKTGKKEKKKATAPPHMVWGSLSVGPVLRKALLDASLSEPTPVQSAAFPVLTSGQNAIIASPTGTGKSLAYLLPSIGKFQG